MSNEAWYRFWSLMYPVIILALLFDRYVLMKPRMIDYLINKAKREKKCSLCERPMIITEAEKAGDDE